MSQIARISTSVHSISSMDEKKIVSAKRDVIPVPPLSKEEEVLKRENRNLLMQMYTLISQCFVQSSRDAQIERDERSRLEHEHTQATDEAADKMRQKGFTQMATSLAGLAIFGTSLLMPGDTARLVIKFLDEQTPHIGTMINHLTDADIHKITNKAQIQLAEFNRNGSNTQSQTMVRQTLEQLMREVEQIAQRSATSQ